MLAGGSAGKESPGNARHGVQSWLGRSPGEGNSPNTLTWEIPWTELWQAAVLGAAKS